MTRLSPAHLASDRQYPLGSADEWPAEATCAVLQLALGSDVRSLSATEWRQALGIAARERLVALIWHERASIIRARAPETVAAAWRNAALKIAIKADAYAQILLESQASLCAVGVNATALKGPALASFVYHDTSVRPLADVDLLIPSALRGKAHRHLLGSGWRCLSGVAPNEQTYERRVDALTYRLEIHSALIDDPLLDYVDLPVETERVPLGGGHVSALSRTLLPAYLAAHQAKHHAIPLLWIVDFQRLHGRLDDADRAAAALTAERNGLRRHYERAHSLARLARAVSEGDQGSLLSLIEAVRPVSELQRGFRLMRLAATRADGLRIVQGRLWPRAQRVRGSVAISYFARRASGWLYRRLAAATLAVRRYRDDHETVPSQAIVRSGTAHASGQAIRTFQAPDSSMSPTIPPFSTVSVGPIRSGSIRKGHVVLARSEYGDEFLGRVVRHDGSDWVLSADENPGFTTRVNGGDVIGVAVTVSAYGVNWRAPRTRSAILPALRGIAIARWQMLTMRVGLSDRRHDNAPREERA
jgi:hypothetical protein